MTTNDILPDVLIPNLKLVICGSAVSTQSSHAGSYYAGQGNKFWKILHETGLTDRLLLTSQYRELLHYQIGLTDVAKKAVGVCFLQAKNACICNGRSNGPGSAFLLLATSHKRMANPVTWTVKNNEMTVVH